MPSTASKEQTDQVETHVRAGAFLAADKEWSEVEAKLISCMQSQLVDLDNP
jgi:hypothetical protein